MSTLSVTYDNLNTSTPIGNFDKVLQDTVFKDYWLFNKLLGAKEDVDGGYNIEMPINKDKQSGATFWGAQNLNPSDKEILDMALWTPAAYEIPIVVSYTDTVVNGGSSKILDLLAAKYDNAKMALEELVATDLFSGTGASHSLLGLESAVYPTGSGNKSTNTYAGISRSTVTSWANYYYTHSTGIANLALTDLQTDFNAVSTNSIKPDMIITTKTIWNRIAAIATAQMWNPPTNGNLGVSGLYFNGVPVEWDENCTAGCIYYLNSKYLKLKVYTGQNFKVTEFKENTDQLVKVKYIIFIAQLVNKNPRFSGVRTTVS